MTCTLAPALDKTDDKEVQEVWDVCDEKLKVMSSAAVDAINDGFCFWGPLCCLGCLVLCS